MDSEDKEGKPDKSHEDISPEESMSPIHLTKAAEKYFINGDISEGAQFCLEHGIPVDQFRLYLSPDEHDLSLEDLITDKSKSLLILQDHLVSSLHDISPYTVDELKKINGARKFSVPIIIQKLITGAINSYGSRIIMNSLNTSEYLAKLASIIDLKKDAGFLKQQADIIHTNKKTPTEMFIIFMSYLDKESYGSKQWRKQTEFLADKYSTTPHAQKERLLQIPEEEQKKFINSLYYPVEGSIASSLKGNELYVYLADLLNIKWNNKDDFFPRYQNRH